MVCNPTSTEPATGFSCNTCFPARKALMTIPGCERMGRTMAQHCTSGDARMCSSPASPHLASTSGANPWTLCTISCAAACDLLHTNLNVMWVPWSACRIGMYASRANTPHPSNAIAGCLGISPSSSSSSPTSLCLCFCVCACVCMFVSSLSSSVFKNFYHRFFLLPSKSLMDQQQQSMLIIILNRASSSSSSFLSNSSMQE